MGVLGIVSVAKGGHVQEDISGGGVFLKRTIAASGI